MKKYLLLALFICTTIILKAQTKKFTPDTNALYTAVEVEPTPPKGFTEYYKFIADHIHYPAKEKAANIQGMVILQFVVERDGSLSDIKALRAPSDGLATEAISVISTAGKWIPGVQSGVKVRVQFTIPIKFSL